MENIANREEFPENQEEPSVGMNQIKQNQNNHHENK